MSENIYKLIEEGQKPKQVHHSTAAKQVSAHKHYNSSAMANLLAPVDGYRGELERKGIKPKNHAKDNVEKMREQAETNKLRKEAERLALQEDQTKKPSKFDKVESKALKIEPETTGPKHEFVKAKSQRVESLQELSKKGSVPKSTTKEKVKPGVPKREEQPQIPITSASRDFIKDNAKASKAALPMKKKVETPAVAKKSEPTHAKGEVPEYLKHRKEEIAEEKYRIQQLARERDYPPGTRLMPEHERQETLAILRENKKKAEDELRRMPLVVETFSMKEKKRQLENKLKEIEEAERMFSQPKVYVEV